LLRIGSIAFIAGVIIAIVSTAIHPSREDPANHPLVFAEYASDDSLGSRSYWPICRWNNGFCWRIVALYRLLIQSESSSAHVLA